MAHPLIAVSQRFMAMKIKESSVKLGLPASDAQLSEQFQYAILTLHLIKVSLVLKKL